MRLSNLFIYGSVIIIVASSLGFLIFKALPISTGGSPNLANKVKALEKENQDLLDESAKTVKMQVQPSNTQCWSDPASKGSSSGSSNLIARYSTQPSDHLDFWISAFQRKNQATSRYSNMSEGS